MTKFEEEAIKEARKSKVIANYYDGESTASDIGLNIKLGRATHNFPWLEFAKNWHSDEEFKAEIKKLTDQLITRNDELISSNYEIESLKSQLISREKQVIELKEADKAQGKEIIQLKSQLQQQALPVVPECVAKWIEYVKEDGIFNALALLDKDDMPEGVNEWLFLQNNDDNINLILRAWLDGYQVEKPQLFYLREKNTNYYLNKSKNNGLELVPNPYFDEDNQFTKQEIDSMQTGSYEQIEVAE